MKKRVLSMAMATVMAASLTACGSGSTATTAAPTETNADTSAAASEAASDFSRYFIMFHHIFFTNDLWILDPSTDMLINIVPEGFFMDTAARIAFLFGSLSLILFGICLFLTIKNHKNAA